MMRLGKYQPSLEISAIKIRVSESRARYTLNGLEVSDFYNLDLRISTIAPDMKLYISTEFTVQRTSKASAKSISVCSDT